MLFCIFCYYIFVSNYTSSFEKEKEKNDTLDKIIKTIIDIFTFLIYPIYVYLWWITVILSYIFWTWLLIIYFVPSLVFVSFIPIPLKFLILEFVPPFKTLTDKGILPLMRRMSGRIIKFFITGNKKNYEDNFKDMYNYLNKEVNNIIKLFFKYLFINVNYDYEIDKLFPKPFKIDDEKEEEEKDEEEKENEEEAKKVQKEMEEDEDKIRIKKLINEEIAICIANKSKLITSDLTSSESFAQSQSNYNNYAECYAKSFNLYINNEI